jgi:adenylate kinase
MPDSTNLVFLGGIADSGKSLLLKHVCPPDHPTIHNAKVSTYFGHQLLTGSEKGKELTASVCYTEWKSSEPYAVDELAADIRKWRVEKTVRTIVLNTHFATYSPGGFMMGLDPDSIKKLCEACSLHLGNTDAHAAVVLIDTTIAEVLKRRGSDWKNHGESFFTGPSLSADLEYNRLFAFQYYDCLAHALPANRVWYERILVKWEELKEHQPEDVVVKSAVFSTAMRSLRDFLEKLPKKPTAGT